MDPALAAAVTMQRRRGTAGACSADDAVFQLALAHVLLDGGYDAVSTLAEVMPAGDHGLGTLDRLDGELVIVDGVPWQVDHTGTANIVPLDARIPFVVLTTMESPVRVRLRDLDLAQVAAEIEHIVQSSDGDGVVAVRLEGDFSRVLVRSMPAQSPPYRPFAEVCATEEVRFEYNDFEGVFVGFRFPDLGSSEIIAGLHLHGVDDARTTGGHNHELTVRDAELSVSVTRSIALALPDRSMIELLEMPAELREAQRVIVRRGAMTVAGLAAALGVDSAEAESRARWLADRGFCEELSDGVGGLGGEPRWRVTMRVRGERIPARAAALLADL